MDRITIPVSAPSAQLASYRRQIDAAIGSTLNGGSFILGEQVAAFEREFADYCNVRHAVGVGSGTDGIRLAISGLGIGPDDEVITVSHTAVATVAAIEMAGAIPVLVDIDPNTYTLDPSKLASAMSARTKAIVPVHLYGQPADMKAVGEFARAHGLKVIEDCAQAHGARFAGSRVGSIGDVGCFSFYPTKNLGALGDGGMLVTNDDALAERLRALREYGWRQRVSMVPGFNSRLDEVQAAILRAKLPGLDADNRRRRAIAALYDRELAASGLTTPAVRPGGDHVYHLYVVRCRERDRLRSQLQGRGIGTAVHYPLPVHRQPAYADRIAVRGGMAATDEAVRDIVSLPMFPELTLQQAQAVADAIAGIAEQAAE